MINKIANITENVELAIKSGFRLPDYCFVGGENFEDFIENSTEYNLFSNEPMVFRKPLGYELAYILFWTGKHFHGGYISLNNNTVLVNRGKFNENGHVIFAEHIPEIKKRAKKFAIESGLNDIPTFITVNLVLTEDGHLYYWGISSDIERYVESIELLTGCSMPDIINSFMGLNESKIKKPEGFVAVLPYYEYGEVNCIISDRKKTITSAWNDAYAKVQGNPEHGFLFGFDKLFREEYHILKKTNKIA